MTVQDLYSIAKNADDAWQNALNAKFADKAGDARYDERGVSTPELKALSHTTESLPIEYTLFEQAQLNGTHYALDGYCACGLLTDDCPIYKEEK